MAGTRATPSASMRQRIRLGVGVGTLVCAAVLAWAGSLTDAHAEDAAHAVHSVNQVPPQITVGVIGKTMMPLEGVAADRLTGFSGDLLMHLIPQDQVRVVPRVFQRRDELLMAACRGDVDVVMSVAPRSQYDHCLEYSAPYLERATAVVARSDNPQVARNAFSAGMRIAVEQGSPLEDELAREHPDVHLLSLPTAADALDAVRHGTADTYVGITHTTRELLSQMRYRTLSIVELVNQRVDALHFAAPRSEATLIRYLDRRLAQLPDSTMADLRARWIAQPNARPALPLSAAERAMLAALPPLRYAADPNYMPYTFSEVQGDVFGILPEYQSYLGRTLGLRFERVTVHDWTEALEKARAGEIDILLGMSDQDARPPGFVLSHPIDATPMVIVGRNEALTVAALAELAGKTVALPSSDSLAALLHRNVPKIRIVPADSVKDALTMVATGQADFTIANLPVADAVIRHHFPGELKVTGSANTIENIGVGVSPRYAALVPLINRALFAMPEGEQVSIRNKWLSVSYQLGPSASAMLAKFGPAAALVLLALAALFIKQTQLRRENRQRRLAEETLARQLSFQRALMEAVPFPLVAKDAAHRYVAVNAAFCTMFGRTPASLLGRTPQELGLHTPDNTSPLSDINRRAEQNSESTREELIIETPDGPSRNVLYWIEPFHLPDGQPAGTVASLVDISEIRDAQARAERLERRLREVTESLPALVYQFELSPGQSRGRITYVAGKAHETLGVQPQDLLGYLSTPEMLIHEDDRQRMLDMVLVSAQHLTPFDQQFRHVGEDGAVRWLHARSIPHREPDGRTVWNGYLSDVTTEREQADALEAAKNAAESALHAKDRFLAMMSHEIRTPMNGVLGLIELLRQTRLDGEQKQMVSLVQDSGRALLHILDDILDYAKIEAGRLDISPAATDLREMFDSTVGLLASRAHEKSLSVRVDVAADVPASVSVDSVRVRQILFNLLSNAIKFTDTGSVRLCATCAGVSGDTARLAICVADTGIGISPEVQATLFAPFVQAERTTTRRYGGTGLGLAISRQLAELMGGKLVMESTPGHGTAVTLELAVPILKARYALPKLSGRSIAIAVDDAALRHSLTAFAVAAGLRVTAADDATADIVLSLSAHARDGAVRLMLEAGYAEPGNALSVNPLNWHAFVQACERALPQPERGRTPSATAPPCPKATSSEAPGAHILVAEDHPINRELIAKQLRLLGYRVTLAEDGAVALERLREHRFDALLTDCHMPGMDGFDLARHIRREEDGGPRLPIIAITATTLAEEHARCRAVGMDASLLKPTTLATLQEALSALLSPQAGAQAPAEETFALALDDLRAALGTDAAAAGLARVFLSSLTDDAQRLEPLLDAMDRAELREWSHRTGGALALLHNACVDAVAAAFRDAVHHGTHADVRTAGARVKRLLDHINALLDAFISACGTMLHRTQVTDS
ncbi:ATP-binding protein [Ralstonia mannitolilytica]|uniref:Virulence sensor protein BvgS n=1 Tax=Ralstonia mannitolilytica TaxID=105219 RepID=A0AAJ5D5W6_9RALS|nr:transporter substrate-binding domain-containing protein [Ralstonia mannitolilytica]CAG2152722.1 Sensor histidine kinase RcsC [Ralstonia mannitolilytica]CAJ0731777.1 Sensor histidine kinase RcsC [Ralstonia mannitolilytica]SUD89116.1 Sensor kinase protein RcsC [Ralstonia mannitolilytica]SUD95079.1 Sensor kinase protein RcsC [Ralstonia mannitolilytica]SUD98605.1 Sensor kinase protein RcsC [Ralstonia mannitolilytica]